MNDYKQNKRPSQSIKYLLSALSLFTLALAQPVFASAAHTSTVPANPGPSQNSTPTSSSSTGFDLAKGSVVRLVLSYADGTGSTLLSCTGLGVVVKSLPVSSDKNALNDWVLTDGSLVDTTQAGCTGQSGLTLSQIQIFFNTSYTGKTNRVTLSTPSVSNAITCEDPRNCSNGPALLAFHGDQTPFIALASSSSVSPTSAIALMDTLQHFPPAGVENPQNFLTPQVRGTDDADLEWGTPLIDNKGNLTALQSASPSSPIGFNAISSLIDSLNKKLAPGNTVTPTPTSAATPPAGSLLIPGTNTFIELWQVGILVLSLLFLLVALIIRPRVQRHRAIKAEIDEADRQAAIMAKRIGEMEATQRDWIQHNPAPGQFPIPVRQQVLQDKTMVRKTVTHLGCPRCGEPVMQDANYCSNCRELLSPSESGLSLHVPAPASLAKPSITLKTQAEFDIVDIRADINDSQLMEQEGGS